MRIIEKKLNGLILFEPIVFGDSRGYFLESYKQSKFNEDTGTEIAFVQDNESLSSRDVLRGLHFQAPPFAQGKLVRVCTGSVLDVAVDIRVESPTFGQHFKTVLSEENKRQLWIPPGFAHGFLTLADETRFIYKCTNYYNKASESGIRWNDEDLRINWEVENPIISEKDLELPKLNMLKSPFRYVQ